jgi:hypothetical protein
MTLASEILYELVGFPAGDTLHIGITVVLGDAAEKDS